MSTTFTEKDLTDRTVGEIIIKSYGLAKKQHAIFTYSVNITERLYVVITVDEKGCHIQGHPPTKQLTYLLRNKRIKTAKPLENENYEIALESFNPTGPSIDAIIDMLRKTQKP